MAASGSRTIIHFTDQKIKTLQNTPTNSQRRLLKQLGKPFGFWYAYGTNWKNLVEKNPSGKKTGHSANTIALRYDIQLPEEAFVSEVNHAGSDTILMLSADNLEAFMERFHRDTYRYSTDQIIGMAFYIFGKDGESAILNELADIDETGEFRAYLDDIHERLDEEEEPEYAEEASDRFSELFDLVNPSREALQNDRILSYDWSSFWEGVARSIGGVEFQSDLFAIEEWNKLWLPWTSKLDVRSGVIFYPSKFRNNTLVEQIIKVDPIKSGGRRRTRRGRIRHQKKRRTYRRM